MKSLLLVCGLIAGLTAALPAQAVCNQAELAGEWSIYLSGHNGTSFYGIGCRLQINASGEFTTAPSACAATTNQRSGVSGHLTLVDAALCGYRGVLTLTTYADVDEIQQTTLSPGKDVLAGIGYERRTRTGYNFTMVRVK